MKPKADNPDVGSLVALELGNVYLWADPEAARMKKSKNQILVLPKSKSDDADGWFYKENIFIVLSQNTDGWPCVQLLNCVSGKVGWRMTEETCMIW
jgi:hypothetical protein